MIAGGGFAGTAALSVLSRARKSLLRDYEILLIDGKNYFEFIPMLPDLISGGIGRPPLSEIWECWPKAAAAGS